MASVRSGQSIAAWAAILCPLIWCIRDSSINFASAGSTQPVSVQSQETELQEKLANNDKLVRRLQTLLNELGSSRDQPKDRRGKTVVDDLRQFVLADDARSAIAASRQKAMDSLSRHDVGVARDEVAELERQIRMATLQYLAITQYWSKLGSHPPDRQLYVAMLRDNSITSRHADDILAHETKFNQQIEAGYFQEAMNNTYPALQRLYDQAFEEEFVDIRTLVRLGIYKPIRVLDSNVVCKPPANHTSGHPAASMDSERPRKNPNEFYSDEIKRAGEEGRLMLSLTVTPEGCVSHAALVRSSGYPRLDDAALRFAVTIPFLPGEQDGKAVGSMLFMPLNFALTEDGSSPGTRPVMTPK